MTLMNERLMADAACLEPIYCDGAAGVWSTGETYTTVYFRWQAVKSENGLIVLEKIPVLNLIRPVKSIIEDFDHFEPMRLRYMAQSRKAIGIH